MRQLLLAGRRALKNEFVALRHGWSEANEAGIIVSRIESGRLPRYGLHAKGRAQAAAVAEPLAALAGAREVVVLASDFSRTLDTAAVVASASASASRPAPALSGDFGDLDGGPNDTYEDVWARDAADAGHEWSRVESVERVLARTTAAVREADAAGEGRLVLLVSHGDALQILQTAFADVDPRTHRSLPHLETSRMQRETNYNVNRYDAGYASASEVTNAVADEGGKDVLTRKNLLQSARFWRDKDVLGVAVSEGGEEYSGRDVLVITAGTYQPIRYTLLDCWQEGAYDHFGSIGDLDPAAAQLEYLAYEALAPFDAEAAAACYGSGRRGDGADGAVAAAGGARPASRGRARRASTAASCRSRRSARRTRSCAGSRGR
ncbi:Histidine phosphatase [Aureococcus anophagefferens]|nr:Histidine phosphatase [Aureococcus anophagefferens]